MKNLKHLKILLSKEKHSKDILIKTFTENNKDVISPWASVQTCVSTVNMTLKAGVQNFNISMFLCYIQSHTMLINPLTSRENSVFLSVVLWLCNIPALAHRSDALYVNQCIK